MHRLDDTQRQTVGNFFFLCSIVKHEILSRISNRRPRNPTVLTLSYLLQQCRMKNTVESHYNGPANNGNPPTPFFYKNHVYKNVEPQISKKLRTS